MLSQKQLVEYYEILLTDPLNLPVWWMLQLKFAGPASMIVKGGEMEEFMKRYSLNGIKTVNLCRPF